MIRLSRKFLKKNRVVAISSSGGHLTELLYCLPKNKEIIYVTYKTPNAVKLFKKKKAYYIIDPHVSKIKFAFNFFQSLYVFLRVRPEVIVSTGSGIAIFMFVIGKIFGAKLIYIESGARIRTPSRTGRFLYGMSNLFIVQYDMLLQHFPDAEVGVLK